MRRRLALLSLTCLFACSASDDGDGDPGAGGEPASQALSEPCVEDHDCIADTVCANGRCAFDLPCDLPGDRMGPCIDSPDGFECQQCINSALTACIASCPDQGELLGMCIYAAGCSDAECILDVCGSQFCDFFACAEEDCGAAVECF